MSFVSNANLNIEIFEGINQKGNVRDMFYENGNHIVYGRDSNQVRENFFTTVEQVDNLKDKYMLEDLVNNKSFEGSYQENFKMIQSVDDKHITHKRGNNERILPSGDKDLEPITILIWAYLQSNSKCNHMDEFRYVDKKYVMPKKIKNKIKSLKKIKDGKGYMNKTIDDKTIRKHIKVMKDIGLIVGEVDGCEVMGNYKGRYYKIRNNDVFKYYVLLENEFIRALLEILNDFTLSLYLVYYGFYISYKCDGICYLNQDVILERMGFSVSGQNLDKLRFANKLLLKNGLIKQFYEISRDINGKEVKRKIITLALRYWETKLYHQIKTGIFKCDKTIKEYRELKYDEIYD